MYYDECRPFIDSIVLPNKHTISADRIRQEPRKRTRTMANPIATDEKRYRYVATGVVANARLSPLLPANWIDITSTNGRNRTSDAPAAETTTTATATTTPTPTPTTTTDTTVPDFLWENSPRYETRSIRDDVRVYSHLPNGINILDSKWVLGRIFATENENTEKDPLLASCETHCFSGLDGFHAFARSVKLLEAADDESRSGELSLSNENTPRQSQQQEKRKQRVLAEAIRNLPDIAQQKSLFPQENNNENSTPIPKAAIVERPPIDCLNWWVVKDAGANGAGGVWVVGEENAGSFGNPETTPIVPSHKYVAQQYVWPPVLYDGKKCHVRVYVTITCEGEAYVHRRAFLHVANDDFAIHGNSNEGDDNDGTGASSPTKSNNAFDDCIHITNCCANSHDDTKFAGEILADFEESEYTTWRCDDDDNDGENKDESSSNEQHQQPVVPLADFFPSVQATVSAVVQKTFGLGLLDGGQKNNGFEYCGMDFMLSYRTNHGGGKDDGNHPEEGENDGAPKNALQPVAYLLEINSPPSQDTASSLPHAEHLLSFATWYICQHLRSGWFAWL